MESEPCSLANELLIAFDECDDERLRQTLKNSTFNLLDAPVRKIFWGASSDPLISITCWLASSFQIARIARTLAITDAIRAAAGERARKEEEKEAADLL